MTAPKYPFDPELNQKYKDWVRFVCQCRYRKETCDLSWEDYQQVWGDQYHLRGRGKTDLVLTRIDPQGTWNKNNVHLITRLQHLRDKNALAKEYRRQHGMGYRKHYV